MLWRPYVLVVYVFGRALKPLYYVLVADRVNVADNVNISMPHKYVDYLNL